jgi:hypothetical protein
VRGTRERHGADDWERSGESQEAEGIPFERQQRGQLFALT